MEYTLNSGDTAWVLVSAGLVLFMTPGLAIFYGGSRGSYAIGTIAIILSQSKAKSKFEVE